MRRTLNGIKRLRLCLHFLPFVYLLLAARNANGIPAATGLNELSVHTGRRSALASSTRTWPTGPGQTTSVQAFHSPLKRVHAQCPCQFRVRARLNAPPFDLVIVPSGASANHAGSFFDNYTQDVRIGVSQTFGMYNRTVLNADRSDAFFHYHSVHVPISASVTLLVTLSDLSLSLPSVIIPSRTSTSLSFSSVSDSDLVHVHLIASTRSASCPVLMDPNPQNETESPSDDSSGTAKPRVVGGDTSGNDIARSMVYFLIRSSDGMTKACSGTLVSRRTVITAAHCGVDVKSSAYLGGRQGYPSTGKRYFVSRVYVPTLFNSLPENNLRRFYYDIAVVILTKDAPANSKYMLVNVNRSLPLPGSAVRVAGYGILSHDDMTSNKNSVLHHVDVPVVPEKSCKSIYAKQGVDINYDYQVCAGYVGRGGCDSW